MEKQNKIVLKVVVIGDMWVGKTSLMRKYADYHFSHQYESTITNDFRTKRITIDDRIVQLQIWDTAGMERFAALSFPFYRTADCCVLVYDVTNPKSFENLSSWYDEFLVNANPENADKFPFVLIGNKIDLPERRVSVTQAHRWCRYNGNIPYFETSAKDGSNVENAFQTIAENALKHDRGTLHLGSPIKIKNETKPSKKCSC